VAWKRRQSWIGGRKLASSRNKPSASWEELAAEINSEFLAVRSDLRSEKPEMAGQGREAEEGDGAAQLFRNILNPSSRALVQGYRWGPGKIGLFTGVPLGTGGRPVCRPRVIGREKWANGAESFVCWIGEGILGNMRGLFG
jgi:hypothetical protein